MERVFPAQVWVAAAQYDNWASGCVKRSGFMESEWANWADLPLKTVLRGVVSACLLPTGYHGLVAGGR